MRNSVHKDGEREKGRKREREKIKWRESEKITIKFLDSSPLETAIINKSRIDYELLIRNSLISCKLFSFLTNFFLFVAAGVKWFLCEGYFSSCENFFNDPDFSSSSPCCYFSRQKNFVVKFSRFFKIFPSYKDKYFPSWNFHLLLNYK